MVKFILVFSSAGFVIPIVISGSWSLASWAPKIDLDGGALVSRVQLLIWPSSIFMMGTSGSGTVATLKVWVLSALANTLLYSVLGLLIWLGIHKQRMLLPVLAILVLFGWYKLWNL